MREVDDVLKRGSVEAAPALLGWEVYNRIDGQLVGGRIIETEAYRYDDPASHTFNGKTSRNSPMFEGPGFVYVYFTYGKHWCMNLVTGKSGVGEAVLLRAIQPLKGTEIMMRNRGITTAEHVADGPAKLTQALGIDPSWSGRHWSETSLQFRRGTQPAFIATERIGITKGTDKLWRFYASPSDDK